MSAPAGEVDCERRAAIRAALRVIPDFPKPGILFQDVSTLLLQPAAFRHAVDLLAEHARTLRVDAVAGFEARGFLFGAPLALALDLPFLMLRKPGKLPGAVLREEYGTEYSSDSLELHVGAAQPGQRVLLVDDLVATGGTLLAGVRLLARAGAVAVGACCVIELPELEGRKRVGDLPLHCLLQVAGL